MANIAFPKGLHPVPKAGEDQVLVARYTKSTSSSEALFLNSPYTLSSGQAVSIGTEATSTIKGSVQVLYNSNGVSVPNLAADEAGTIEGTIDPNQIFTTLIDDGDFAAGDVGKGYNFIAETATAGNTAPNFGSSFSGKMLDGDSETAVGTQAQVIVQGLSGRFDNSAGAAYTEVFVRINPANNPDYAPPA